MTEFEIINQVAIDEERRIKEEELAKEKEYEKQKSIEDSKMVNYLFEYLSAYVEQLANLVVRDHGKEKKISVPINEIVFNYTKTPYIMNYKTKYDQPVYEFIRRTALTRVQRKVQEELNSFHINMYCDRWGGFFRANHRIIIIMKYEK